MCITLEQLTNYNNEYETALRYAVRVMNKHIFEFNRLHKITVRAEALQGLGLPSKWQADKEVVIEKFSGAKLLWVALVEDYSSSLCFAIEDLHIEKRGRNANTD